MFHACAVRFDMTENLKNIWQLNKTYLNRIAQEFSTISRSHVILWALPNMLTLIVSTHRKVNRQVTSSMALTNANSHISSTNKKINSHKCQCHNAMHSRGEVMKAVKTSFISYATSIKLRASNGKSVTQQFTRWSREIRLYSDS